MSFLGGLDLAQVAKSDRTSDMGLPVASLLDLAGTKAAVLQKRAEVKDYLDIDAILKSGVDLPSILAAGGVIYRRKFNPVITLKALSYFDDVQGLPDEARKRISRAVASTDLTKLPMLVPFAPRIGDNEVGS